MLSRFLQFTEFLDVQGVPWTSRRAGLILGVISAGTVALALLSTSLPYGLSAVILLGAFLSGYALWAYSCTIPKVKDGHIGIALAIKAETIEELRRIRSDFIEEITNQLQRSEAAAPFQVLEIRSYLAPNVNDKVAAANYLAKSKCRLLIWGKIKTRQSGRGGSYSLTLEGVVTHSEIPMNESQALASEMRVAIPEKTQIGLTNELKGFEAASSSISLGTKYIVALASALSGDLPLSKTILQELEREVQTGNKAPKSTKNGRRTEKDLVSRLRAQIPRRLADITFAEYYRQVHRWQNHPDDLSLLASAESALDEHLRHLKKFDKEGPQYWVPKALLALTLRQDISAATQLLNPCKARAIGESSWRLSLAFIKAITGDHEEALNLYDVAITMGVQTEVIFDVEAYIQWWISKNEGPAFLYLLLAMLNGKAKKDADLALSDLDRFIALVDHQSSDYELLMSRANTLKEVLSKQ